MVRMSRPAVPAARPIATSVARSRGAAVALSGGGNGGCIGGGVIIILASPAAAARRCRIFLHLWEAGEDVVVASGVTSSSLRSSGYGNPGSDRALRSGAVLPRIPTPDLGVEWRRRRRILAAASWISAMVSRCIRMSGGIAAGGASMSVRKNRWGSGTGEGNKKRGSHGGRMLDIENILLTDSARGTMDGRT